MSDLPAVTATMFVLLFSSTLNPSPLNPTLDGVHWSAIPESALITKPVIFSYCSFYNNNCGIMADIICAQLSDTGCDFSGSFGWLHLYQSCDHCLRLWLCVVRPRAVLVYFRVFILGCR